MKHLFFKGIGGICLAAAAVLCVTAGAGTMAYADDLLDEAAALEDEVQDVQEEQDEGSDFASSWDSILYEDAGEAELEDWQEEQYEEYLAGEQPLAEEAAQQAAEEAEAAPPEDVIADSGEETPAAEGIIDGMEPGLSADELSAMALERALVFMDAPYSVLEPADPEHIRQLLSDLTRTPSPTGSDGELEIGQYIMDTMEELGYHVTTQSFHEDFLNEDMIDIPGMNILAEKEVNDPDPTEDVLLVIAHYDSKTGPEENDPLANDKTGVAAAMEAARLVAGETSVTDVCFVFLSGEEDGLYGSASFIESIEQFLDKIIGVICLGPNGYVQTLSIPVNETETEEIQTVFPTVLKTESGTDNAPANMLLTSAAVQQLSLQSGILEGYIEDGYTEDSVSQDGFDGAGADSVLTDEAAGEVSLGWRLLKDEGSSCTAFSRAGLETALLNQQFTGTSQAGLDQENVQISPDEELIAENADIAARAIGMYMAGIR